MSLDNWTTTAAPDTGSPSPHTGGGDDFKTPLIIFFVTLVATAATASLFGALYWFVCRRFVPRPVAPPQGSNNGMDVQMTDRLLPPSGSRQGGGQRGGPRGPMVMLEDNCDGDADAEMPSRYHLRYDPNDNGQRANFLLLPEAASHAGSAQANSGSDEDDVRSRVTVQSASQPTQQRKWQLEWLNAVVSAYMESQLTGVPLEPPVVPPAPTRGHSPPTSGVASDRSDVSDVVARGQNPVAKRLQYLKSRASDSSSSQTQPSTTMAAVDGQSPPNGPARAAPAAATLGDSGVHSAPSQMHSPENSGPTAIPLSQLLEAPLTLQGALGVPLPAPDTSPTTLEPRKQPDKLGAPAVARHSPPRSQTTPRKILNDTSSSSSSDRSASHARHSKARM